MLKIWGRLNSINVQKVVWCARDLGCDFERIDAGGIFGVVDTPAFGRLNPNRKVPVLEDGDMVLTESNAIVRYLCAKHAEAGLSPAAPAALADCDRWMDWQATELQPSLRDAFMQTVRTPPAQRQQALLKASINQTEPLVAILDAALAGRQFINGDRFSMADIPLGCAIHRWYGMPIDRVARPNVSAWFERVRQRPGAQAALTLPLA